MPRENAQAKSRRYLTEGRLHILRVDETVVIAVCKGDGAFWWLGHDGRTWHCDCDARSLDCSHLLALRTVVVSPKDAVRVFLGGAAVRSGR
jgi:hypothetical protein